MNDWQPTVYILANAPRGTLYVGVTSHLPKRVGEHCAGIGSRFCQKYAVTRLVHAEIFDDMRLAIERETRLKRWRREWKLQLIESANPQWVDLSELYAAW